jgi:hypothetical protein
MFRALPQLVLHACLIAIFRFAAKPLSWSLVAAAEISKPLLQQAVGSMPPTIAIKQAGMLQSMKLRAQSFTVPPQRHDLGSVLTSDGDTGPATPKKILQHLLNLLARWLITIHPRHPCPHAFCSCDFRLRPPIRTGRFPCIICPLLSAATFARQLHR